MRSGTELSQYLRIFLPTLHQKSSHLSGQYLLHREHNLSQPSINVDPVNIQRCVHAGLRLVQPTPPPTPTPASNFIGGHPKAALLFWFFGYFRCGVLLFMVILIKHKYKNRSK